MLNILLVDDEPDVRISLGQVLREEGHAVDMVGDAETALVRLSAHPFDLVVSDVKLPKLDGLSLLKRVRGEFPVDDLCCNASLQNEAHAAAIREIKPHIRLLELHRTSKLCDVPSQITVWLCVHAMRALIAA